MAEKEGYMTEDRVYMWRSEVIWCNHFSRHYILPASPFAQSNVLSGGCPPIVSKGSNNSKLIKTQRN